MRDHSPVVAPARAAAIVGSIRFSSGSPAARASSARAASTFGLVAQRAPAAHRRDLLGLHRLVDDEDAALGIGRQRRLLAPGEAVLAYHGLLERLDPAQALAVGVHQGGLHVGDGLHRAAVLGDHRHLRARALQQLRHQPLHHLRALEDVGVLEDVGLVRQHLLDAQRPLLVPRARQPQRLVPRRQLDRARASIAADRHRQRLQHDPLHVVLRLRLGEAERVDLHAVAQPQQLRVADAVALPAQLLPQDPHRAQLCVLLDEAHAGVDEERDPAEDLRDGAGVAVRASLGVYAMTGGLGSPALRPAPAPALLAPAPPGGVPVPILSLTASSTAIALLIA